MLLTINGITQPITEWALDYGIPCRIIRARLNRGWTEERAVTEPMPANPGDELTADDMHDACSARTLTFKGRTLTPMNWASVTGLTYAAIKHRLRSGWSVERTLTEPPSTRGRPHLSRAA